jgi:hypothetical protein
VAREAGENNKEFSAAQKICQNLLVIFAGPPLATDYNLMFGGFFRLAAGNHKPLDEIFSARPRPSPLSLLHVATQYLSHTHATAASQSRSKPRPPPPTPGRHPWLDPLPHTPGRCRPPPPTPDWCTRPAPPPPTTSLCHPPPPTRWRPRPTPTPD